MASTTYKITSKTDPTKPPRLITAPTKHQAIAFVARSEYEATVPSGAEMYDLGKQGVAIEDSATPPATATA